jgi:hypothetical protein
MAGLIFVILFTLFVFIVFSCVFWTTHIGMVKENVNEYGYANFKTFLNEFNKYDWVRQDHWEYSYFGTGDEYNKYYIHADIIKFNGKGMILYPHSYIQFKIWSYKNRIIKTTHNKKLWDSPT